MFSCLFVYIFTGVEGEDVTARQSTNAYMLVYIRKTSLKDVLCPVTDVDIPQELSDRLNAEKQMEIDLYGFTSDCEDLWYDYAFLWQGNVVPR